MTTPFVTQAIHAAVPLGAGATLVTVRASASPARVPSLFINLPPDATDVDAGTVRETMRSVETALLASGVRGDGRSVVIDVDCEPSTVWARGTRALHLAMAVAAAAAIDRLDLAPFAGQAFAAGLSGFGLLAAPRGLVGIARAARAAGLAGLITVDDESYLSGVGLVEGLELRAARQLCEVLDAVRAGDLGRLTRREGAPRAAPVPFDPDLWDTIPPMIRRALSIAAAGGHHALFVASMSTAPTVWARALVALLPDPTEGEALDIASVHSAAGIGGFVTRPWRAPHHTASAMGLVGGGDPPRPGEIALADGGVLFLDGLPEFSREGLAAVADVLRDRAVVLVRGGRSVRYDARLQLIATTLPCPCGFGVESEACECGRARVVRYLERVSVPLGGLFDLVLRVSAPGSCGAPPTGGGWTLREARVVVRMARERAQARQLAEVFGRPAPHVAGVPEGPRRAHVARVARTIADLAGADVVVAQHVDEALSLTDFARAAGLQQHVPAFC